MPKSTRIGYVDPLLAQSHTYLPATPQPQGKNDPEAYATLRYGEIMQTVWAQMTEHERLINLVKATVKRQGAANKQKQTAAWQNAVNAIIKGEEAQ